MMKENATTVDLPPAFPKNVKTIKSIESDPIDGEVTGKDIKMIDGERREGDPAVLIADSTLIQSKLGWAPEFNDLHEIVSHAWHWEKKA